MRRTAVGIDLGTIDVFAANVGRKGVDIVQNGVSERRTPALVGFTDRRRLLGDAAYSQHHGEVGYEVNYRGQEKTLSATVCLSMLLTSIVATCKAWTKMEVQDVVLAIPSYFTEGVRQACVDALRIAGVQCLRLLHESTAIALAWRFERRNFEDTTPVLVAFCSVGHSGLLVAVVRFEAGGVAILAEAYDQVVSGRSMDRILMERFAESLRNQGASSDSLSMAKVRMKLEEAAAKVKKTLSVVDEARASAECVVEDLDLSCSVQRQWFEEKCAPLVKSTQAVVGQALAAAGVSAQDLSTVEMVGGCSRVPFMQRALREAFGDRELSTTLNADEAVARGCAWQAAMLSPLIRLDQIPLKEGGTLPVVLEWVDTDAVEAEGSNVVVIEGQNNGGGGRRRRLLIFEAQAGPNVEAEVALRCRGTLELRALHVAGEEGAEVEELGCWTLAFPAKEMEDVELQCTVDMNGIFTIAKAAVCKGKEAAAAAAAAAAEAAEAAAAAQAAEEEAKEVAAKATAEVEAEAAQVELPQGAEDAEGREGGVEAKTAAEVPPSTAEQQHQQLQEEEGQEEDMTPEGTATVDAEAEKKGGFNWRFWQWGRGSKDAGKPGVAGVNSKQPKRKIGANSASQDVKIKREEVKIVPVRGPGYTQEMMAAAEKAELAYRKADAAVVEAENQKNEYETRIFTLREKLLSSNDALFMEYTSPEERGALAKDLEEAEAWTYENTNEDASVYADRLLALTKRERETANRKAALEGIEEKAKALRKSIQRYKATANSSIYEYIAKEKRDAITQECDMNTEWLTNLERQQAALQKWQPPVLSGVELAHRNSTLTKNATKILSEPKPKPPEPEKVGEEDKKKKKKGDKGEHQEEEEDEKEATVEEVKGSSSMKTPRSRRKWTLLLSGGLLVLGLPILGLLAGWGTPYGIQSPLPPGWYLSGGEAETDFEEMQLPDSAELSDMQEDMEESTGDESPSPLVSSDQEL